MTTQTEALKLVLEALVAFNGQHLHIGGWIDFDKEITAIKEALAQQSNEQVDEQTVTVLPDGSASAIVSYPLPKTHWIYAERKYADGEDEPIELGKPILTHEVRDAVISAVRYAIRGATMCGKESDFDPDALVQNAVYALCGPYTPVAHPPLPTVQPEQEPVAAIQHWCTYCQGHNIHNCQFNMQLPRFHTYTTNNTATSQGVKDDKTK